MEELRLYLRNLIDQGASPKLIDHIEKIIEKRSLRIKRNEDEIREFVKNRKEQEDEERKKSAEHTRFLILIFLMLLAEEDRPDDEIGMRDLFPGAFDDRPSFKKPKI